MCLHILAALTTITITIVSSSSTVTIVGSITTTKVNMNILDTDSLLVAIMEVFTSSITTVSNVGTFLRVYILVTQTISVLTIVTSAGLLITIVLSITIQVIMVLTAFTIAESMLVTTVDRVTFKGVFTVCDHIACVNTCDCVSTSFCDYVAGDCDLLLYD
jgi:hypothetical protein